MGELRGTAEGIGKAIIDHIKQIADDEDTEVDGWLQERDGRLVDSSGEVVRTFDSRA